MGLAICGVVLSATSSAATLMGDFRTSYICLAAPRAMFAAQLVGQLLGAVLTPMCFMLFFQTGQVGDSSLVKTNMTSCYVTAGQWVALLGTHALLGLPECRQIVWNAKWDS